MATIARQSTSVTDGFERNLEQAKYHAWFHHHQADGWITVAKKEKTGQFRQYHYKPDILAHKLSEWLGEDVYFSQNTFYKPARAIENIRQLRALYTDVDFYVLNQELNWVVGNINLLVKDGKIPEPNLVIFSGNGLVCVWLIEPVPYKALPLWQAVQNYLSSQLEEYGSDSKAIDAARIFRLSGSINSKNGQVVHVEYQHDYKYVLRDIQQDYLPELTPKKKKSGRPSKLVRLHNVYSLHHARLLDIIKLVELRNHAVTGYRETLLFLYRYWKCCFLQNTERALAETISFNNSFTDPLPEREVIRATKSAEKAYQARSDAEANRIAQSNGYPAAGYNIRNVKLIEWLSITEEEQTHLLTIIGANEKRRRNRVAMQEARRAEGIQTRQEYEEKRKEQVESKLERLREIIQNNPLMKKKDIAAKLGISDRHLRRLMQEL